MKKILFVPAWWPCGFFYEQQNLTSDYYESYVLYGNCQSLPMRNIFSHSHGINIAIEDNTTTKIDIIWKKYKSNKRLTKQKGAISEFVGRTVLKQCNGKPNLIHIQSISDIAVFVAEWAKQNNIPIILTEHILFVRRSFDSLAKYKENLYNQADKILCVSNYVYRNLLTSGFLLPNASVIGNLVNDKYVSTKVATKNGKVLFVASHTHDKDIETLLKVATLLQTHEIVIDIIGLNGQERLNNGKSLIENICNKRLNSYVHIIGPISHEELLLSYSNYSCLISPSRSETFGISVAEAIAYGTPVVYTNSGGISDFVNSNNGIIVDIGSAEQMAQSVVRIVQGSVLPSVIESQEIISKYGNASFKKTLLNAYDI